MTIRPMSSSEVPLAIEWADREGWNPGLDDAQTFHAADPEGFWIGEVDHEPVAVISAVRSGKNFGFLGFYIVHPDFRAQGYGLAIWNRAMDHLAGRTIGLDGVVDQQDNYRKSGFQLAYRNIRQQGTSQNFAPADSRIVPISQIPFETLCTYDRRYFPANRSEFLQSWIGQEHGLSRAFLDGQTLRGYSTLRKCREGWKFGPLFADTPAIAETLFQALQNEIPTGETIFLDTPEPNAEATDLAQRYKMRPVFETARMYRGQEPSVSLEGIYGVTSFELG